MASSTTDFDLHEIVGIRLLDAQPRDVATVTRQLGPTQKNLNRDPDITIRFVDDLNISSQVRLLGVDDVGFTDDAFLILRGKQKSKVRVQIPFEDIGLKHCEIIAERGLPAIPHLIAIVNLAMIAKDTLPLHASAFDYQGVGALATGWAKGGKTETLLAFTANGAHYVGDEWVYLSTDGNHMYGIPEPIRLWKWHFEEMPQYLKMIKRSDRLKLWSLKVITQTIDRLTDSKLVGRTAPVKILRRMNPILKRQLNVQVPPKRLFGETAVSITGTPQMIFFVASHESPELLVEKVDPQEIAHRMVFSLQEERTDFMSNYLKFRFAFPDKRNELIETLEDRQRDMLVKALADKETYTVYHPYPLSIPAIYEALNPLFKGEV